MSKTKKIIYIIVIMLLITTIAISSYFILKQVLQEQKQDKEFGQLEAIINIPMYDAEFMVNEGTVTITNQNKIVNNSIFKK